MGLLNQAIRDVASITSSLSDFASEVELIATNAQTATINALHNKIGRRLDTDTGLLVNTKNASVVFSESILLAENSNYPIRNSDDEVSMLKHLVNVKDSTGRIKNYIVKENIPDETIGLITLILGDYAP